MPLLRSLVAFLAAVALSATVTVARAEGPADKSDETRIALVIGNADYSHVPALANPKNDAEDMTAALERLGFEVLDRRDLNLRQMQVALEEFARRASKADTALVYYAGHGMQSAGENYLVPVDAQLSDEISVYYQTLHINEIFRALDRAPKTRLLFIDACRNLPLPERSDGQSMLTGLAKFDARRNMVIAYATAATEVAYDGLGRNSFFTGAVLEQIEKPGLEISQLMLKVSASVSEQTGGRQVPETSRTLAQEFFFAKPETDAAAWARIAGSEDPVAFEDFLIEHADSPHAAEARTRLLALRGALAPKAAPNPAANATAAVPDTGEAQRMEALYFEERLLAEEQRLREEHQQRLEAAKQQAEDQEAARLKAEELRLQREFLDSRNDAVQSALERQRILEEELRLSREYAQRQREALNGTIGEGQIITRGGN